MAGREPAHSATGCYIDAVGLPQASSPYFEGKRMINRTGKDGVKPFCDSGARVANYDWRLKAEMDSTHCIICHHFLIA